MMVAGVGFEPTTCGFAKALSHSISYNLKSYVNTGQTAVGDVV